MHNRFVRFVLVGAFNTAFGYGLYLVLLELGLPIWAAWGGALAVSLVVAFVMSGWLVFRMLRASRFIWYLAAWAIIYVLNLGLIHGLVKVGIGPRLAPLAVLPLNALLSFFLQQKFVFLSTKRSNDLPGNQIAPKGNQAPLDRADNTLGSDTAPLRGLKGS